MKAKFPMIDQLIEDLTAFIKGESARSKPTLQALILNIMQAARANPAWQKATYEQWERAAEMAILRGLLVRESSTIWFPVVKQGPKEVQGELF